MILPMLKTALLPHQITAKSISKNEIVLPITEALEAIDFMTSCDIRILGWEGWLKASDGRIGHGNAPQGTSSLEELTVQEAAQLCKETIKKTFLLWKKENIETTDELYFCITYV
jgi:hypothetical protein